MNPSPAWRAPHAGNPSVQHAPNAALLIDFDNVTMAIRSDLGKELKALLNSEVIRGKVSVQRAYADWRRYPQYIVPLAESSIDLIFAPAYGSSKKNATDLRMAIDAIELVFTRPEIGTYILLTGDSDFSSCVLKLKEYGKYVIGVGMRESSSDLLIQNCDEYYSYHALSGLTRADEVVDSAEDPWQLVRRAAQQMVTARDVMRTDRLKQVMLGLDPSFDEKKLGYSKFSRFVQEAATKGLLRLKKLENGQHEITLDGEQASAAPAAERERERPEHPRSRRGENGRRGRREAPAVAPERDHTPVPAPALPAAEEEPAVPGAAPVGEVTDLPSAYALLRQALGALAGAEARWVRDGDVKRKMLELTPGFDEAKFGFPKFSRFLRQAHDSEVVDLNRVASGHYEVALSGRAPRTAAPAQSEPRAEAAAPAPEPFAPVARAAPAEPASTAPRAPEPAAAPDGQLAEAPPRYFAALRGRRPARGVPVEGPPPLLPGQVIRVPGAPEPAAAPPVAAPHEPAPVAGEPAEGAASTEAAAEAVPAPRRGRGRRGGRGRAAAEPPALLPGQVVEPPSGAAPVEEAAPAAAPEEAAAEVTPPPLGETETAAEAPAVQLRRSRSRGRKAQPGAAAEAPQPTPAPAFSAEALGLPRDPAGITAYLSNSYRGIGKKTAEALLDSFGSDLFRVMHEEAERVRATLGDRRAETLLEQWTADYARRSEAAAPGAEAPAATEQTPAASAQEPQGTEEEDGNGSRRGRPRGRRGGRGRPRKKREEPASA